MVDNDKKYALITGASKGIGKCIAEELGKRKYNLLLVARSETELQTLASQLASSYSVATDFLAIDLALSEAADKVVEWCKHKGYSLSILVNNAGYGTWGKFEMLDLNSQLDMLHLNMLTLVKLTHNFLPKLKSGPSSYILNIGSTAAYQAVPTLSLYAASKAFVLSFSRGLSFELKDTSVSVTCVCPGPVNTHFVDRAGLQAIKATAEKFGMTPEEVAHSSVTAMFAKKREVVPGFLNKVSTFLIRFVPKLWVEKTAASIYNKI